MLSCKCLNILIELDLESLTNITINNLNLSILEKADNFFKENVQKITKVKNVIKVHSSLVTIRIVGKWVIHQCLLCNQHVYAIHCDKDSTFMLINCNLLTQEEINVARASRHYSDLFNILVSPISDENEYNTKASVPSNMKSLIENFNKITNDIIQREKSMVEERIKLYAEQQVKDLETMKVKAMKQKCILISNAFHNKKGTNQLLEQTSPINKNQSSKLLQEKTESITILPNNPNQGVKQQGRQFVPISKFRERKSKYSGATEPLVFEFDVSYESDDDTFVNNQNLSDSDQRDETEEETDESENSISPRETKANESCTMAARSLPMNIPAFLNCRRKDYVNDDGSMENYANQDADIDIAASIKAIAKSVHGNTIFGELPCPRTRTQM